MTTAPGTADYSEYAEPATDTDLLQKISRLAQEQREAELDLAKAEEELSKAQERLRQYREVLIPTAMAEARQDSIVTADGFRVTVEEKIRASIPEAAKPKAFAWLDQTGNSRIIKHEFKILFGKEDDAWAKKFQRDLAQRVRPVDCKRRDFVEPMTLSAFIKGALKDGVDVPLDLFGAFRQRYAEVKRKD
jgi:hypothetical protein